MAKNKNKEIKKFEQAEFVEKLADHDIFLFKCTNCEATHFRHAGYMESMIPYIDPKEGPKVSVDSKAVKVCVNCKHSFILHDQKFVDVTEKIDLKAWEKTEKEAYKATGPGGEC